LANPKTLAIVSQNFYAGTPLVSKDEHEATEWIRLKDFPARPGQAVYAPSEVNRLHGQKNPHLWGNLDHSPCLQKIRAIWSGSQSPRKCIFILAPLAASISSVHSEQDSG
jgi:hypothetical protein